jgi:hypothetical protein
MKTQIASAIHGPRSAINLGLLPYQADRGAPLHTAQHPAANPSRFQIGLSARQTGNDHTATFEAVVDSIHNQAVAKP